MTDPTDTPEPTAEEWAPESLEALLDRADAQGYRVDSLQMGSDREWALYARGAEGEPIMLSGGSAEGVVRALLAEETQDGE